MRASIRLVKRQFLPFTERCSPVCKGQNCNLTGEGAPFTGMDANENNGAATLLLAQPPPFSHARKRDGEDLGGACSTYAQRGADVSILPPWRGKRERQCAQRFSSSQSWSSAHRPTSQSPSRQTNACPRQQRRCHRRRRLCKRIRANAEFHPR